MEREGGPTPWLKALLSRVAKDTSGDEVLSLQGLEGKGDRVPIVWAGVCTRAGSSRWAQLDVQVGRQQSSLGGGGQGSLSTSSPHSTVGVKNAEKLPMVGVKHLLGVGIDLHSSHFGGKI